VLIFADEDEALWNKLVKLNYGAESFGWWSKMSSGAHGVGCLKSILAGVELFRSLVCFEVNNEATVKFWHDL